MKTNVLDTKDYIVFLIYFVIVAAYGLYIYNKKNLPPVALRIIFLLKAPLPGGPLELL